MTYDIILITNGEPVLTPFKNEDDFREIQDSWYAERWLFYKRIIELVKTRENLPRYGDFCDSDESVTDWFMEEADYWLQVYYRLLEWDEKDFQKFESKRSPKLKEVFKYGEISNGDSGIHWKSVGEAFNWKCHICGQQTERKGGTHLIRRGCTVDHIVPQSKGGANTWNNVLPAHWDCNIKKNARI